MHSSAVERRIADPEGAGSIPAAPFESFFFYVGDAVFGVVVAPETELQRAVGLVV